MSCRLWILPILGLLYFNSTHRIYSANNYVSWGTILVTDTTLKPAVIYHQLTHKERTLYILQAELNKSIKSRDTTIQSKKYHLKTLSIKLINKSDSVLKFIVMSCSFWENFQISNPDISFLGLDCDHNITIDKSISPHQAYEISATILIKNDARENRFKVGMSLQKFISNGQLDVFPQAYLLRPESSNMIWSDTIAMP